ncbi:hypothetical protein MIND_01336900 [Mycena indigotica]|uniref:F-box domain-containing protein n=1 Tax=Mycena indigotica TaxID=2126181 RepID=A0A8H6S0A7_9AGAR|nr:uncharacterized protein MIND_01336900 [Mycena indigotica]KAF7290233.1 hypothetical protein MIND_01336900 [Mycena indigotica]
MQDSTELPPELMARIFSACLPPTQDAFPHADTAPMLLCRVCRRWRSIALSTPELWATFVAKDGKASVETLKLWSDRSGSLPLTYVLDSNVIDTGKILLETATAYKQRWGTLILHLCDQSFAPLNSISSCRLPLLRSLELKARWRREGHGMTAPDPRRLPTFDLGGAPNLTELRLTSYPRNHLTGIPWHRLTVLKLEGRVVRRDMERLALCRALVDLTLSYPGSGPIIQPALNMVPELVHLPQLQSLTTDASEILTCLRLPRLRHLDLEVFGNEDPLNLLSALRDWACTLRSLTVTRPSPGVPLSNILPGIPTLQLLSLDFRYSDSLNSPHIGDLRPLISIFKDPHILMHLRRITVTCCSTKWETPDVLRRSYSLPVRQRIGGLECRSHWVTRTYHSSPFEHRNQRLWSGRSGVVST